MSIKEAKSYKGVHNHLEHSILFRRYNFNVHFLSLISISPVMELTRVYVITCQMTHPLERHLFYLTVEILCSA